jgi:uncharacterized protein (TIGR04551 family)
MTSNRLQRTRALAAALAGVLSATSAHAQDAAPAKKDAEKEKKPGSTDADLRSDAAKEPSDSTYDKVFVDEWFKTARPTFEIHGYFRVRSELFAHFDLNRHDNPGNSLWARPASDDYSYIGANGSKSNLGTSSELCGDNPDSKEKCESFTQAGANMRLRIRPTLTISDNIRAVAELDLFDNIVLGSTPDGYANEPQADGKIGGYRVRQRGGYTPIGAFSATQWSAIAGTNSLADSIEVKRAYGEYVSPIGTFRFGRMPDHWGLGMVYNAGDDIDSDYASTIDRIQFKTGIRSIDLYFAGMWDFANEGAVGGAYYGCSQLSVANPEWSPSSGPDVPRRIPSPGCDSTETQAQRYQLESKQYDLIQSDDVYQIGAQIYRKRDPNLAKLELAQGDVVVNGGAYALYRWQHLESFAKIGANRQEVADSLVRRGYETFTPDLWGELMWKKFKVGVEAALVWGAIENTNPRGSGTNYDNPNVSGDDDDGWNVRQFGFTLQSQYRAIEDRLRIDFGFGFSTGDDDVEGINGYGPGNPAGEDSPLGGLDNQLTQNRTFSTFRFHPDYRVDQILWRRIIGRVQSAYYFKPGVSYDFIRGGDGQRAGGGVNLIWSRAVEPVQTAGNQPDLGVEIDTSLFYQAIGGTYDADGKPTTGFYGQLDYAVLFPLGGLGYLPEQAEALGEEDSTLAVAQMLRLYLGVLF